MTIISQVASYYAAATATTTDTEQTCPERECVGAALGHSWEHNSPAQVEWSLRERGRHCQVIWGATGAAINMPQERGSHTRQPPGMLLYRKGWEEDESCQQMAQKGEIKTMNHSSTVEFHN